MKQPGNNFGKFAKKKSNAAIKEQFKQEKRKDKKEREAFFDQKKAEARQRLTPNVNQQSGKKGQAPAPVSHQRKERAPARRVLRWPPLSRRQQGNRTHERPPVVVEAVP